MTLTGKEKVIKAWKNEPAIYERNRKSKRLRLRQVIIRQWTACSNPNMDFNKSHNRIIEELKGSKEDVEDKEGIKRHGY